MNLLQTVRSKLVAPKSEWNEFGGFAYRTKGSILEKLKPILQETDSYIQFKESVTLMGDAVFIVSEAQLLKDGEETVFTAKGFAWHAREKKSMDLAQLSGATTSYAQKSALEALFLIDGSGNLDEMKPSVTIPGASKDRAPVASSKTTGLNWLNLGTKEFSDALTALKVGKTTLDEIKKSYRVSKATEQKLITEIAK